MILKFGKIGCLCSKMFHPQKTPYFNKTADFSRSKTLNGVVRHVHGNESFLYHSTSINSYFSEPQVEVDGHPPECRNLWVFACVGRATRKLRAVLFWGPLHLRLFNHNVSLLTCYSIEKSYEAENDILPHGNAIDMPRYGIAPSDCIVC